MIVNQPKVYTASAKILCMNSYLKVDLGKRMSCFRRRQMTVDDIRKRSLLVLHRR
jgi:hypothetical protein